MSASRDSEYPILPIDMQVAPDSRGHKLLTTNSIPDSSDAASIQSDVLKSSARLAFLDNEISRLKQSITTKTGLDPESSLLRDQLLKWEGERALLSDYHAQNKGIISPLRRMPPELLGEIFLLTLPARVQDSSLSTVEDSPWVLAQVCSGWRQVAISTPALWSRVAIDYYKKPRYSIPMIETQIQRAQLLRIYFYGSTQLNPKHQLEMLRRLAEHSSRWKELSIGVTEKMLPLLAGLRNSLPMLQRLWIQWEEGSSRRHSMDCFLTAPSLRDLTIYNDSPGQVALLLPAQQLTRYDADGPWEMHRPILLSARNLIEVRIESESAFPMSNHEIIELSHLQRLFVSRIDILNYFKAPALEGVAFSVGTNLDPLPHLDPLVARSACILRRLSLRSSHPVGAAPGIACGVSKILKKYPTITSLAILTPNPGAITSLLTIANANAEAAVGPQLSKICLGAQLSIDWVPYIEMLESRWRVEGCSLRSATAAVTRSPPHGAALTRIDTLLKDGLNISVLEGRNAVDIMGTWVYTSMWG
ncbi:hypothetical protein C8R43DRAFT_934005 [Mycena crocata]|nr:hypothetical protein C8R43DRAFT_934005 [Mycena crocata]